MSDEFSDQVKRVLANRVGHKCSNPECRALTSGPQDDSAKSVNVGVAAHITAASPGGPRYDPDLLPEERSAPSNGIWLCQNDGKLVDNDEARFTVDVLMKWKSDAEAEARERVGRTHVIPTTSPTTMFVLGSIVRIAPIVPREYEQSDFEVMKESDESITFEKLGAQRGIEIPKSLIESVHRFTPPKPSQGRLTGRLQWLTRKRIFEPYAEKPETLYGIPRNIDSGYAARYSINGKFGREERLPELFEQGWVLFYDSDGCYLRWGEQALIIRWQ
jgi:hypothetical protein